MFSKFLSNRRQRAERRHLRELIDHCWKRWRQDHDLLSAKQETAFRCEVQQAQNALTAEAPDLPKSGDALVAAYNRCFPPLPAASWRENGEVILVALVVAMAVRAFFLQPFKIPTGSMQPTLNGITVRAAKPVETRWWYRLVSAPLFGETVIHHVAEADGALSSYREAHYGWFHYGGAHGFSSLFSSDATEFTVGQTRYSVPLERGKFEAEVLGGSISAKTPLLDRERTFKKGETILSCVVQTGDHLFVDRFTYHFRKPDRGDVFVFETRDIENITAATRGEFYIKRLAGLPGDTLQIKDPYLWVNGEIIAEPRGFCRVMSEKDGYRGYTSHLTGKAPLVEPTALKAREYFALGDNSYSSSDSRVWGPVPYKAIVGRGFFVFWPFTRHFGRVD